MPTHPNPYREHLGAQAANRAVLTPFDFLLWAADAYPRRLALVYDSLTLDWQGLRQVCQQMAERLAAVEIGEGDTVSVMLPNIPEMLYAHFAVPMSGAVLHCINTRLDAPTVAYMLAHCAAKVLIYDREYEPTIAAALAELRLQGARQPLCIRVDDPAFLAEVQATHNSQTPAHLPQQASHLPQQASHMPQQHSHDLAHAQSASMVEAITFADWLAGAPALAGTESGRAQGRSRAQGSSGAQDSSRAQDSSGAQDSSDSPRGPQADAGELAKGVPRYPDDEGDAIALNYTSGTTGHPKGVVVHHRGAYLNALSNVLAWAMPRHPVYLWTLPMFHCNGWCFPWTIAALAGVNVCVRRIDPAHIFALIRQHRVSHYCAAPIVHSMLINAPRELRAGIQHRVACMVAGAAPPAAMIAGMESMGFDLTHVYGLTEVYGPSSVCAKQSEWEALDLAARAERNARQGLRYPLQRGLEVMDPDSMREVARDGKSMGEVMFRGNSVMSGYLKDPEATAKAFAGGWFHTGDLGVVDESGYVRLKDRAKDIIISGGENISSLEVEDVLHRHPAVLTCAVVAKPDPTWGETPLAFVELKPGSSASAEEIIAHCRSLLAHFKCPREVRFMEVPKTSTGKIQKQVLRNLVHSASAIG